MNTALRAGAPATESAWGVLAASYGLRFVTRDMGNGVRRLLSSHLVPLADARAEVQLPGREALAFPPPEWLLDITFAAIESLGISVDRDIRSRASAVFARHIDDSTMELIAWRS